MIAIMFDSVKRAVIIYTVRSPVIFNSANSSVTFDYSNTLNCIQSGVISKLKRAM